MSKTWTVVMVLIAAAVAFDIVQAAFTARTINVFTGCAAAGYIVTACIARIAEAWRIQL